MTWKPVPLSTGSGNVPPQILTLPAQNASSLVARFDGDEVLVRDSRIPFWQERLRFFQTESAWVTPDRGVKVLTRTDDAWAGDWSKSNLPDVRTGWRRPAGGVGWYKQAVRAYLRTDVAAGAATVPLESFNGSVNEFPPAGQCLVRDRLVTFSGVTEVATNQRNLTGCVWSNPSAFTFKGLYTPVIMWSTATVGGGDIGGYGSVPEMVENPGAMVAAGFTVQEKLSSVMNAAFEPAISGVIQPGKKLTIAPFYVHVNIGQDLGAADNMPGIYDPPTAYMLGPGRRLTSTTDHLQGFGGSGHRDDERGFKERLADWADTTLNFTNQRVKAIMYGTMATVNPDGSLVADNTVYDTGEAYQGTLSWRYIRRV